MKDVIVVYPVWNRLDYNKITLPAMIDECRNSPVFKKLVIIDDMSVDGTTEWIESLVIPIHHVHIKREIGNSTQQWNIAVEEQSASDHKYIANFTNENVPARGSLERMRAVLEKDESIFGIGPHLSGGHFNSGEFSTMFPYMENENIQERPHLGCGMFRRDLFLKFGPVPSARKYFGFTQYQNYLKEAGYKVVMDKGIRFLRLDESPIYSQCNHYMLKGWCRDLNCKPSVLNGNIENQV